MPQAISLIKDGAKVVVGGVLTAREPNAIARQIIKDGKKDLHMIAGAHSFTIDLLCAGGAVGICEDSFVGYEFDLGLALNYRRACEQGRVKIKETDCNILLQQFRATQYGVPFMPMPKLGGSDLLGLHPEFITSKCPYTGTEVTLVPAIKPDVAIIHAHFADPRGNVKIVGPIFKDKLFAIVAETVIVSVEKIISENEMKELQPTIPYYHTTAIVEAPFGAHPTSCYPQYAYDRKHLKEFVAQSKNDETIQGYLKKYVCDLATNQEYLDAIGGDTKMSFLQSWSQGTSQWMEVFK
jgi:glutaconate CoA-transferase subunit A